MDELRWAAAFGLLFSQALATITENGLELVGMWVEMVRGTRVGTWMEAAVSEGGELWDMGMAAAPLCCQDYGCPQRRPRVIWLWAPGRGEDDQEGGGGTSGVRSTRTSGRTGNVQPFDARAVRARSEAARDALRTRYVGRVLYPLHVLGLNPAEHDIRSSSALGQLRALDDFAYTLTQRLPRIVEYAVHTTSGERRGVQSERAMRVEEVMLAMGVSPRRLTLVIPPEEENYANGRAQQPREWKEGVVHGPESREDAASTTRRWRRVLAHERDWAGAARDRVIRGLVNMVPPATACAVVRALRFGAGEQPRGGGVWDDAPDLEPPVVHEGKYPLGLCRAAWCWDPATWVSGGVARCGEHHRAAGSLDDLNYTRYTASGGSGGGVETTLRSAWCTVCGSSDVAEAKLPYMSTEAATAREDLKDRLLECHRCVASICGACLYSGYVNAADLSMRYARWRCARCRGGRRSHARDGAVHV